MIHSFSCKNYYSFSELTTVSFVVNDKAPSNNGYFIAPSGNRLSKIETVIGHNASGKTNLLKILPFFKWIITSAFDSSPDNLIPVKPFMFGEKKNEPTEISVDFEINGKIYTYFFILNEEKIILEELKVKNKTNKKETKKKLFSRRWDSENNKYELDDKRFNLPKEFIASLRTNASVISLADRFIHQESRDILKYWENVKTNVIEVGWIGDHYLPKASKQLTAALSFYGNSNNENIKKEAEKLLSRFDLGLDSLEIEKKKTEDGILIDAKVSHYFAGQKEYLPIEYESSGTKQLLVLLRNILTVLSRGGIAVLDEFDVNLHPEMVLSLFEMFIKPETNPNNAQLLFSTHSHLVLSRLDKYQIVLVEKNKSGESESWRLDEMSGVRSDDNYYTKYIAGAYGAVPRL